MSGRRTSRPEAASRLLQPATFSLAGFKAVPLVQPVLATRPFFTGTGTVPVPVNVILFHHLVSWERKAFSMYLLAIKLRGVPDVHNYGV
jgi:hypothetical protein